MKEREREAGLRNMEEGRGEVWEEKWARERGSVPMAVDNGYCTAATFRQ